MADAKIYAPEQGFHNANLDSSRERLKRTGNYQNQSTIIVVPTRSAGPSLCPRVVTSWMALIRPMNQQVVGPYFMTGYEVGEAYNTIIRQILADPRGCQFKYILTLEDDVMPPPDGLIKLYESIEGHVDGHKYDVMQGLYWTKGEMGQPMIYGNPTESPASFRPQIPKPDAINPARGLGMGFNLFRVEMFKDKRLEDPWFKTLQEFTPGVGTKAYTQDLYFYERAGLLGYRFACDTRVRCGHYDNANDMVW
jgi:hypothetical protein